MQKTEEIKGLYHTSVIYLCALFLGLPLILNKGYFNMSATKSLYFLVSSSLLCVVALALILAFIIRKRKVCPSFSALDGAVIAFGVVTLLSAVTSEYQADVWLGRNSRLQGAVIILMYVLVYLALSNGLRDIRHNGYATRFLAIGFLLAAGLALLHACSIDPTGLFTHLQTSQRHLFISTLGNINFFSAYISLCVPVFIVLSAYAERRVSYICWGIVLVFCGIASVLTCSESCVIAFAVFVAVAPFFFFNDPRRFLRFALSLLTVLLTAAVFYRLYESLPELIYKPATLVASFLSGYWVWVACFLLVGVCVLAHFRPSSLRVIRWVYLGMIASAILVVVVLIVRANTQTAKEVSEYFVFNDRWGHGRGKVYRLCAEVMQDFTLKEWLLGVGPETLQTVMKERGIHYIDQAHSEYLQTLLTTGLLGLLAQFSVMALTVMAMVRRARLNPLALALFMGLVAYWAQASVNIAQPFTTPLAYAFVAVIGGICKHDVSEMDIKRRESK